MKTTRFITFYSFKGGVGRSLALANAAYALAAAGNKVVIIDMDIEAPGQHMTDLFRPRISNRGALQGWPGHGLLEMFEEWMNWPAQSKEELSNEYRLKIGQYLRRCRDEVTDTLIQKGVTGGELWLIPAGNEADPAYISRVSRFDWERFYEQNGEAFLKWLRHSLRFEGFDYVLIDARTGLSKEFYVATLDLADTVVLLTGFNWQNIEGTHRAVDLLRSAPVRDRYGEKRILLIGSPMPSLPPDITQRRLFEIREQWPEFVDFNVTIPYEAELALEERIRIWERQARGWKSGDYARSIDEFMKILLEDDDPIEKVLQKNVIKPQNPFALLRRDYIEAEDVVRYFVDPGEVILKEMALFTPLIITGARGTGKTMLASKFSVDVWLAERQMKNQPINAAELPQIGLYFRIDADFLHSFNHNNQSGLRKTFNALFSLYFDIVVIRKALDALEKLGGINTWCDEKRLYSDLCDQFGEGQNCIFQYRDFGDFLEAKLTKIRLYLNNPDKIDTPILLPPNVLMKRLMEHLERDGRFRGHYFAILIDEYENYADYQQEIINTRLKQSRRDEGITYRLFARSGGLRTRKTLAPDQNIEAIHDYRLHSLDEGLEFDIFFKYAIEVANRHLSEQPWFAENGYTNIENLIEDLSADDEARLILKDRRVLENWIEKKHVNSAKVMLAWFDSEEKPLRRAVATVLLNQGKSAQKIVEEFRNNTGKAQDWYHNYHRGALYWLCRLCRQPKKYAGLNQIVGLAGNNIRIFLDFCQAIVAEWLSQEKYELPIPWAIQDAAIHRQALTLRENLYSADRSPQEVNNLLERFGRLCELAHKSPKQSEPEINHFSINVGDMNETERKQIELWLNHAWYEGVLRKLPGNKQKALHDLRAEDWQLAPWFGPLFSLSTRHIKKIELSSEELRILFTGSDDDWRNLFKSHKDHLEGKSSKWKQEELSL